MEFIKYYWGNNKDGFRVSVRTNYYNRSLAHIQDMIDELKKDHPGQKIKPEDVDIVIYNTTSFASIMGVEWNTTKPHRKYFRVTVAPMLF